MPLTLEERERRAYIENSPDHPLIEAALEAQLHADDELRHEVDSLKGDLRDLEAQNTRLQDALETASA